MKKMISCLVIVALLGLVSAPQALAASSASLGVSATVSSTTPEINLVILKFTDGNPDDNPWTNSEDVTGTMSLAFGTLVHTYIDPVTGLEQDAGVWFSNVGYCVVVFAQGFGRRYEIRSTSAGIAGLPSNGVGAFGITPIYSAEDEFVYPDGTRVAQGTQPTGSSLGTAGTAVMTNKRVYLSENPSTARILQVYYGVPPKKAGGVDPFPGWTGIPLTHPSGSYSGSVTISIVPAA